MLARAAFYLKSWVTIHPKREERRERETRERKNRGGIRVLNGDMSVVLLAFLFAVASPPSLFAAAASAKTCNSVVFSNRLYATCDDLPQLSSSLHWTYDARNGTLSLAFVAPPAAAAGWISWAVNPTATAMIGSQTLIAFRQPDGSMGVKTFNITGYSIEPSPIDYPTSDLAADYVGGRMRIFGKLYLPKGTTTVNQVWQVGAAVKNGIPGSHAFSNENLAAKGTIDLVGGQTTASVDSMLRKKNIHGILNAVSWGILLPMGAIAARYLKTFKSADPAWFYLHVSCQLIGYGVGVAGWATGLNLGEKTEGVEYPDHRNIGIALFAMATVQVFALLLRPNKDHKYRFYWNIYHHSVGYAVIVLGVVNVFKGLDILSPDHKWMQAYVSVICFLGGIALLLEAVTWVIVLRRKSDKTSKPYDGAEASNGHRGIQPLSV